DRHPRARPLFRPRRRRYGFLIACSCIQLDVGGTMKRAIAALILIALVPFSCRKEEASLAPIAATHRHRAVADRKDITVTSTVSPQAAPPPPPPRYEYANAPKSGVVGGSPADLPHPTYAAIAEHDFFNTSEEAMTTFSIDVDRASYANIRRFLAHNQLPPAD